jgi:hypothetical protein
MGRKESDARSVRLRIVLTTGSHKTETPTAARTSLRKKTTSELEPGEGVRPARDGTRAGEAVGPRAFEGKGKRWAEG